MVPYRSVEGQYGTTDRTPGGNPTSHFPPGADGGPVLPGRDHHPETNRRQELSHRHEASRRQEINSRQEAKRQDTQERTSRGAACRKGNRHGADRQEAIRRQAVSVTIMMKEAQPQVFGGLHGGNGAAQVGRAGIEGAAGVVVGQAEGGAARGENGAHDLAGRVPGRGRCRPR